MSLITITFSLLLIKVIGFFLKLLPAANFSQLDGFLSVSSHVVNIFAWARSFVPVPLILALFSLVLGAYTTKFMFKLVNMIISIFK